MGVWLRQIVRNRIISLSVISLKGGPLIFRAVLIIHRLDKFSVNVPPVDLIGWCGMWNAECQQRAQSCFKRYEMSTIGIRDKRNDGTEGMKARSFFI